MTFMTARKRAWATRVYDIRRTRQRRLKTQKKNLHERERIPNHETTHSPGHELRRQRRGYTPGPSRAFHHRLAHFVLDLIDVRAPIQVPKSKDELVLRRGAHLEPDAVLVQVDVAGADEEPVLVVDEHLLQVEVRAQGALRRGGYVRRRRLEEQDERTSRGRQHAVD